MTAKAKTQPAPTPARVQVFAEAIQRGESQSSAYREMHPSSQKWTAETVHVKASIFSKVDKVIAKVEELRVAAANRNKTTIDTIDKMHKAAFVMAKECKQGAAMTAAANNLAKLHGLIIDRSNVALKVNELPEIEDGMSDERAAEIFGDFLKRNG